MEETWRKINNDWQLRVKGRNLMTLSFNPDDWLKDGEDEGDFKTDSHKDELLMLAEGALYPYGYEPIYRDTKTKQLVMKRNRSLTPEQEAKARKFALDKEDYKVIEFSRRQQEQAAQTRTASEKVESSLLMEYK